MKTKLTGSLVGPIGAGVASSSGATLVDSGSGYDFAIGGQGFHIAPSDENPYERATAQFRKEQLDTSDNVGDQSLVGYWTRGQLSFHKGAGVKYSAGAEDAEQALRYWGSEGVTPFTPGEVTLHPAWESAGVTVTNLADVLPVNTSTLALLDNGTVRWGVPGQTFDSYTPAGFVATSIATGGGDIFCATSQKRIAKIGTSGAPAMVYSEGFEVDTGTWTNNPLFLSGRGGVTSFVRDTAFFNDGIASLKTTWPAGGDVGLADAVAFEAGRQYTLLARVYCQAGLGAVVKAEVFGKSLIGSAIGTDAAWVTYAFTFVATASSEWIGFSTAGGVSVAGDVWFDKVQIFEGSLTDYPTSTSTTAIYSHTEDIQVFFAKDRLFVVDDNNVWYQLAPNPSGAPPVAIVAGDKIFSLAGVTGDPWCVCDTPGPVLFANSHRVFAVSQDTSNGTFPSLTGPVQVAELPTGEIILDLTYHLGFLVITTNQGVRVGILADSGSITYGPRLVDWDGAPRLTGVARRGTRVAVAGGYRLIEIDLSAQVGDGLEFGFADLPNPLDLNESAYGLASLGTGLVAWTNDSLLTQSTSPTTSGTLHTSFHRFGTLEPKKFQTVRVRVGGTGGSVSVAKVLETGAIVPLHTLQVNSTSGEDVTLAMDSPAEMVALKFTLTSDGDLSPTLLGYQLRALPAPQRQRLIRIPLLLQDVERRGTTRAKGKTGSAWERLSALEEMESSGGTFIFQDFRTGESGQCFIESVEHKGTTPPGRQSDGFGGYVFLTIRKL